ncbi:MAG: 50S ribosomal protein L6 [Hyphomicrobiaceae bacterium]|nr:50S ribosomal protein L6 [Hyphomicrobiaceae bacterium]
MSRVGKNPVTIPQGVQATIAGDVLKVKGKLGELSLPLDKHVTVTVADGKVSVKPNADDRGTRAMWGTTRAHIRNMVEGVTTGYVKELEISGVGFRAAVQGSNLQLQLGFSHDVVYPIPAGIKIACEKPTAVKITGFDKQRVGQVAAEIRGMRPPEPYKGKGIKYVDETILRKEGKKK